MNEYVKTEWVDNDSPAISAANLNHIESGIEAVTNAVIALHNAGVSPEQITATITAAVAGSLSNKMDKLGNGSGDKIIVSTANGSVQRSTYNITNADSDFNGGATNKVPTSSLVWRKTAQRATDLGRETAAGFVTPNYKLVYVDSNDNLHVLFDFGLLHVPTKTSELTNDSGYIFPVCVGSIDACTQPRTLYYTVFENRHAYVFNTDTADSWMDGKKVYTDIIRVQYVFVDGKIRTRDRMYHDDTASWSEWSTWKVTGTDNYNELTNRPRINGHTLSGDKTPNELGLQKKLTAGNNVEIDADGVISAKTVFAVNLTLTSWTGGVMDKTAGQIAEAYNQGKTVIFKGMFDGQELSLKAITMAVGTEDETITISAIAITEPDGTLYHVYIPRGKTDSFSLRTYNLRGIASVSVNQNGTISFYDADGNLLFTTTGASVIGPKGDPGDDYILTPQDKTDIANIVLQELPTTQGVLYGDEND